LTLGYAGSKLAFPLENTMARKKADEASAVEAAALVEAKKRNAEKLRQMRAVDLLDLYVKLRDDIGEKTAEFNKTIAKSAGLMAQIEAIMVEQLDTLGLTNVSSKDTTAFFENKTFCKVEDWDNALAYVIDNAQWQFLTHAIRKESVREYMDANEGATPPGIKWTEERALVFRKKS
jgi:hypothetical protein